MGYYAAGDYYQAGDYYPAGDPGLFGFIGKVAKRTIGSVAAPLLGNIPGVGAAITIGKAITGRRRGHTSLQVPQGMVGMRPKAGLVPAIQRAIPGGASGMECVRGTNQDGSCRKKPSMNYTNPKALRRAMRRTDGFVKVAKRALKGSKYQIVTRGAASSRKTRRCR